MPTAPVPNLGNNTIFKPLGKVKNRKRLDAFITHYLAGDAFELKDGGTIKLKPDEKIVDRLNDLYNSKGINATVSGIMLQKAGDKEAAIKFSMLKKTAEYGAVGSEKSLQAETKALTELIALIDSARGGESITIQILSSSGKLSEEYSIVSARKTADQSVKSDIELIDETGKAVVWLSHKDGNKASDFQQWGGVSQGAEPKQYNDAGTKDFVNDLQLKFPNIDAKGKIDKPPGKVPAGTTIYRKIAVPDVKMRAVYGNEYGAGYGQQNVTATVQGHFTLNQKGPIWILSAEHAFLNGEALDKDYEPVYIASYRSSRGSTEVGDARLGVWPLAKVPKSCLKGKECELPDYKVIAPKTGAAPVAVKETHHDRLLTLREYINLELETVNNHSCN